MVPGVPRFTGLTEKVGEGCGNWKEPWVIQMGTEITQDNRMDN